MLSHSAVWNNPSSEPSLRQSSLSSSDYPNSLSLCVLQLELMHPPSHVAFHVSTVPGACWGSASEPSAQSSQGEWKSRRSSCESWPEVWDAEFHLVSVTAAPMLAAFSSTVFLSTLCASASRPWISISVFQIRRLQCHVPVLSVITSTEILHLCLICRYCPPELCSYLSGGLLFLL